MEEKQEKKQEPELKGKMPIVWLTGILVIILGCVTVYTFKLVNENKKLKQTPELFPEQAKSENIITDSKQNTTGEIDKDALEVYGLDTKFKEISKVALEKLEYVYNQDTFSINLSYDLNNDGKMEKITNKGNNIYLNNDIIYEAVSYTIGGIYIIDINKDDEQKELVLKEIQDNGILNFIVYYISQNGKTNKTNYVGDINFYLDSKGKFITLNTIEENLIPIVDTTYYEYKDGNIKTRKIDLSNISKEKFIIKGQSGNSDKKDWFTYFIVKNEKEIDEVRKNTSLKEYYITEDLEINILSIKDYLKVKLRDGSIRYIYPISGYLAG